MTVAAVGPTGDAAELFRGTAHSPSYFALNRAGVTGGGQELVDFCIPCNPYFPTPAMFAVMAVRLRDILTYYPSSADTITAELADVLGLQPQTMAMGNGSTELITWIDHLLVKESLAVPIPTFGRWTDQPMETGKRVDMFQLPEMSGFALDPTAFVSFVRSRGSRVAVICNPNNPDGGLLSRQAVIGMMDALADLDLIVIDESFLEFADTEAYPSVVDEAVLRHNVIVLRSLGKNFGLHGVRFGYLVANPALAVQIRSRLPKWNLNSFAEVIVFMLKRYRQEYMESLRLISLDRQQMTTQLAGLPGMTVYPSQGNFVFVKLPAGLDGSWVRDQLLSQHGVLVRECGNKLGSSSQFMRLVVRSQPDVQRLLTGLSTVMYGTSFYAPQVSWEQQTPLAPAPQQEFDYLYQQTPQLSAAPMAPEPQQQMYTAAALPMGGGMAPASTQAVSYGTGTAGFAAPQQPMAELAPAYVATPPVQMAQYPAAAAQAQMPPMQSARVQLTQLQAQLQAEQAQAGQAALAAQMQTAPAPQPQSAQLQSGQMVSAQTQTAEIPAVQTGAPVASYGAQDSREDTTIDQIPVYGQQRDTAPEPSVERTQAISYDPAELRATARPVVDDDPDGLTPALQRYPRPAAYLRSDDTLT
ncbi:histidinol-phosphate aminotransferase family protein [Streptomyces sp. NA02950]|uniref:pyridoxal phosphate-dependent aminotransferase n=1 Tax=Streptomyces sp. NA02950 TaxID=2742137 RepID=UPI001591052D|nr:histidinol-phosphate transaminase [Streptomyces sp. NA02950]QKV96810.1 histidinol-phosphate aminotransferase family protein [Streptomyces sp. NA02950]